MADSAAPREDAQAASGPLECFTFYSQSLDHLPKEIMATLGGDAQHVATTGENRGPVFSYLWDDGLSLTCNVMVQEELAQHLLGFIGYVTQVYPKGPDARGKQIIGRIGQTKLAVGIVVQPGRDPEGRVEDLLSRMMGGLTPILFYGDSLHDHLGRLLLAPDGSFDPEAEIQPKLDGVEFQATEDEALPCDSPSSEPQDEDVLTPPTAARVAQRALVLASLACRASLEEEPEHPTAVRTYQDLTEWIPAMGIKGEFEPAEWEVISSPLGQLPERDRIDMSWRSEGLAMLAWALRRIEFPLYDQQVDGPAVGDALGFLNDDARKLLDAPELRSAEELDWLVELTLAVHWRLREYSLRPNAMNFAGFALKCQWAAMPVSDLTLVENDLALRGNPVSRAPERVFGECLSIARERQQAANWLIGTEPVYTEVTCDT